MRSNYVLFIFLNSIISILTLLPWSTAQASVTTEKSADPTVVQIQQLQDEVAKLKEQVAIINSNQRAIAKHTGLVKTNKQPTIAVGNSATIGNVNAKIALIEFTDLHCPFCKQFNSTTYTQLKEKYIANNDLLFVGKHYPIPALHKNAFIASQALECAREQSGEQSYAAAKSWLFAKGQKFNATMLSSFAETLSLDNASLNTCMSSAKVEQLIAADIALAKAIGINQTPSFVIGLLKNGEVTDWKIIAGAKTVEQFSGVIDQFLALAKTKG